MIERLLATFAAPTHLSGPAARAHVLRRGACWLGGSFHAIQAVIFWAVDLPGLAALSVLSVIWFAVCGRALTLGWGRLAILGIYAEVTCHSLFLTTAFGLDSGYVLYSFTICTGLFLVFTPDERTLRDGLVVVSVLLGTGISVLGGRVDPWIPLQAGLSQAFLAMNTLGTFIALIAIVAYFAWASSTAEAAIERERKRSEDLLLNVLPAPIAARLKDQPGIVADHFDDVSVLFADLAGFTELSATLSTHEVLEMLNALFSRFDALADRHGLEKIKTIGDAYMVVGGLPSPLPGHTEAVARFALDLRAAVRDYARDGRAIDVRIGIHSGPVVAGVIGVRKFSYDLWGDTVNTASRMESHGARGRIHVTDAVRSTLGDAFAFEDCGVAEIKGKGPMRTWFLEPQTQEGAAES